MISYLHTLKALEYLLDKVGETYWRDWIREDIMLWETENDTAHHLAAYGGMGSLTDLWICATNGHDVTEFQEIWVNCLLARFRDLCFQLARTPHTEKEVETVIGKKSNSILSPFRRYRELFKSEISDWIARTNIDLSGWRCLSCGYEETQPKDIENTLARIMLPRQLSMAETEQKLIGVVDDTLSQNFPGIMLLREQLEAIVQNNRIAIVERGGWMRPCPQCGSHEAEVYQW